MCLVAILTLTAAAGIHEPQIHDELAQLVEADIFSAGHLAEAPHPFWQHFETFHVLSQPSYQGKFPPGPSLFIALGQRLIGEPIAGVWLQVVVMIVSIAYALYGWLPPRWALLGTTLVALRFGIVGDWAHSYWGGAVAAAGGGFVLGAAGRLVRTPTIRDGLLLGTGLVLLAFSRPYEGLAYSVPALVLLLPQLTRSWQGRRRLWLSAVPAAAAVCIAGLGWLGYYNWRVTGSPARMPHLAYEQSYSAAPLFVFQSPRVPGPILRHREMDRFEQTFSMHNALGAQRLWPREQLQQLGFVLFDYLKPTLLIAFTGLLFARRGLLRAGTLPAACLASVVVAMLLSCWSASRYFAPATASVFLLVSLGMSGLARMRFRWFDGPAVLVSAVVVCAGWVPFTAAQYVVEMRGSTDWWAQKRAIRQRLDHTGGSDLVFVHYRNDHNVHHEWVYNGGRIDGQPIVWAREMSPESDAQLRAYFQSRKAWTVFADEQPARLVEWQRGGDHSLITREDASVRARTAQR